VTTPVEHAPRNFTDLTGRVAVLIGGTSGLGRAIAIGLGQAGADVVPAGRSAALVAETCEQIRQSGRRTLEHCVDVVSRSSVDTLRDVVCAQLGGVDVLVNAAGRTARRPTAAVTTDEWVSVLETNLTGTLHTCQAFFPTLSRHGRGRIVNIASLSSFVAFHEVAAYGASKAAVLARPGIVVDGGFLASGVNS